MPEDDGNSVTPVSLVDWDYWLNRWPEQPVALTRANAADGYPSSLTPLSQDLVLTFEEAGVRRFYFHGLKTLRPEDAPEPYMQAFYGLIYLNADQLAGLGEATPGSSRQAMYEAFFGLSRDPDYRPPRAGIGRRLATGLKGPMVLPRMLRLAKAVEARIASQVAAIEALRPPHGPVSDEACQQWLLGLEAIYVEVWESLMQGAGLSSGFFEACRKALGKLAADSGGDLNNRLHVGLGGNESAEAGRAIRQLAEVASEDPAARRALEAGGDAAGVRRASPAFAARLDDVLRRYGYRAAAELELANDSWRANPDQLVDIVRVELRHPPATDRSAAIRQEAEAELERRLNVLTRPLVHAVLRKSRWQMAMRENSKIPVVLLFDELRRILEIQAPRLVERGVLPDFEAIHYLRYEELKAVLAGQAGPGLDELDRRRTEHQRCLALQLPELVEGGPGWIRPLDDAFIRSRGLLPPEKVDEHTTRLQGVGASPGTITAVARVLDDPLGEFEPGDVLVARTVDPGWAPILACAGGVVLDIGGLLSHGAVVARELGIPCVVNVKAATRLARSGEKITVDGSTGEVVLAS
jgi:phosphohistidine swiveling domain-containing protein